VPRVSEFYGIVIWLYRADHPPAHFHAQYGEHWAKVAIADARVIEVPCRRELAAWCGSGLVSIAPSWRSTGRVPKAKIRWSARVSPHCRRMRRIMARPTYYVTKAEVLEGYRLQLTFEDQTEGVVDLSDVVARGGVFRPLKDPKYFRLARADADAGTVVWPNEVDVAPEELYARARRSGSSLNATRDGAAGSCQPF